MGSSGSVIYVCFLLPECTEKREKLRQNLLKNYYKGSKKYHSRAVDLRTRRADVVAARDMGSAARLAACALLRKVEFFFLRE